MKLVLFGSGKFASLAWYCLRHDSPHEVVAFAVDRAFRRQNEMHGLPVLDFEDVSRKFPPHSHHLLFPIGAQRMNALRMQRYYSAKQLGYEFATYVSSKSITWPDLVVGDNSMIFEGSVVQPFAGIGLDTIIRSSVHVSHHVQIGDHCFVAAGACFGGGASVKARCFIGLNATIRDEVSIAEGCYIAAGAVVIADTEPNGLYLGVPARRSDKPPESHYTQPR